jgi:hypothetical protein
LTRASVDLDRERGPSHHLDEVLPWQRSKNQAVRPKRKPWVDPDDAPELTDEMLDRAEISEGGRIIRPGRPPLDIQLRQCRAAPRAQTPENMTIAAPLLVPSSLRNIPMIGTF